MGVVRTDKWLFHYKKKWNQAKSIEEKIECQRDLIIEPLCGVFQTEDVLGLHQYLLQMGLFLPDQSVDLEYEKWQETLPWTIIQEQFHKLQRKWNGPDVKIYILPLNQQNLFLKKELGGKTGLSLNKGILLFVDSETTKKDLLALITHEYHHICRLQAIQQSEDSIPFLESMIMEGLAEWAVKEELGEEACAAWTTRYDHLSTYHWFERWIRPNLFVKGRKNYLHYLYGNQETGIPLWLGYYVGFQLIKTATRDQDDTKRMLEKPAEIFLERSKFSTKR